MRSCKSPCLRGFPAVFAGSRAYKRIARWPAVGSRDERRLGGPDHRRRDRRRGRGDAARAPRAPEGGYFADGDRAAGVFGVLATGFSVLLGFVVFLAFTSYDQSRSGAEQEALVLVQQVENAQFFPQPASRPS